MTGTSHDGAASAGRLEEAMRRFAGRSDWSARPFADGMTNRSWRVTVEGRDADVVVQALMEAEHAEGVGIQRHRQFAATDVGVELGISPRVYARYEDISVVVSEFVEGTAFPAAGERRARAIVDVARALRALHGLEPRDELANAITAPLTGTRYFIESARSTSPAFFAEFADCVEPVATIESVYEGREPRLTHNDMVDTNIIVGEATWLIDWEYSGLGDPYSDLGDFAGKCRLDADEERVFVEEYAGRYDQHAHAWLRVYRYINILREALWALTIVEVGKAESDYDAYARFRFAQVREYIAGEDFRGALEALSGQKALASG